jgi:acetyl-CoA carboxylase biotin carboxyl carrier protein
MDLKRIEALLELLANHDVSQFWYKDADAEIELQLGQPVAAAPAPVAMPVAAPVAAVVEAAPAAPVDDGLITVESPMVGTFYRAPGPGAPSFVEVGAVVGPGQTLCIVEAMKLMNEIEAETSGTIVEILIENAQPVQFGQAMFKIKP